MKNTKALIVALGLTLPAVLWAQDEGRPPQRPPQNRGGDPGFDGPRPVPPLMAALDANRDSVIDDAEIKNASEALRKMDKNGDGKLTLEELRPRRPDGAADVGPRKSDGGDGARAPRREHEPRSPEGQ